MKRLFKKVCMGVTMCAVLIACAPEVRTQAAEESIPKKVRLYTGNYYSSDRVDFSLKDDVRVKSVKSSSKNLIVKLVYSNYSKNNGTIDTNSYTVEMYGKKSGKYTITIKLSDGSSKKITVFAYPAPYSYKINGKKGGYLENTSKKSVKFKISLTKGNKLSGLSYTVTKKKKTDNGYETSTSDKAFKNGGTVKINSQPYEHKSSYSNSYDGYKSESESMSTGLFAYTSVTLKYKDKYTKQIEECNIGIASKLVK